jgi:hypothetical protein
VFVRVFVFFLVGSRKSLCMCMCGVALYLFSKPKRTESSRWRSSRFWSRKACEGFETVQKIRVSVLVLNEFVTGGGEG